MQLPREGILVVPLDRRAVFREKQPQADRRCHLAVGEVVHDFAGRPAPGTRARVELLRGNLQQRLGDRRIPVPVQRHQLLSLFTVHRMLLPQPGLRPGPRLGRSRGPLRPAPLPRAARRARLPPRLRNAGGLVLLRRLRNHVVLLQVRLQPLERVILNPGSPPHPQPPPPPPPRPPPPPPPPPP